MEQPSIENLLTMTYVNTFPGDSAFEDLPNSPLAAIQTAIPKEEALLDMNISDRDLYYSFLSDVVKDQPMNLQDESSVIARQREIAQAMWKEKMDYFRIIRCLTYMPLMIGTTNRYTYAVFATTSAVNPVLTLPEISQALPVNRLDAGSSKKEIYHAYLHAVLTRNPAQKLQTADKEVVRLLQRSKLPENTIRHCLEESQQFIMPEPSGNEAADYLAKKEVTDRRNAFLDEALQSAGHKDRPMAAWEISPLDDDTIYHNMQEAIRNMKDEHERGDCFQYWEQSVRIMQNALNKFNAFWSLSKTISIMTVGISRAAKECEIQLPQDFEQIQASLQALSKQKDASRQDWVSLRETTEQVVLLSTKLLTALREKKAQNPLLSLVEVQHADALPDILKKVPPNPQGLYFSALREIARGNPGIQPDQADVRVAKLLKQYHISENICIMAISHSPCFRQLESGPRMSAARSVIDAASAQKKREEGIQR